MPKRYLKRRTICIEPMPTPLRASMLFLWIPLEVPGTTSWPGKVSSLNLLTCSSSTMPLGLLMISRQERYFFVLFCFVFVEWYHKPDDRTFEFYSYPPRNHRENSVGSNRVRKELFKETFFNRIPYLWNNLPDELRTANFSVSSFKKLCITFYKDKAFDPERPHTTWAKISS